MENSSNSADTNGGGIENRGNAFAFSTSIIDNDADRDRDETGDIGGGVHAVAPSPSTRWPLPTRYDAPIAEDGSATLDVYGHNVFGDLAGCLFAGNGNAARGWVSAGTIAALGNNGGPTPTHALLAGS